MSKEGHNSGGIAADALKSYLERIERLEEEKKSLAEDIKDIYSEAKSTGFDPKVMRKVLAERKKDKNDRDEQLALFDIYWDAINGVKNV
tara:strand:- start:34 stop:300 length:267 start_codon:yes stop_codon:yes gene_type:complete